MLIVVAKTGKQLDLSGGKIYLQQAFGINAPRDIIIGRHDSLNKRAPDTLMAYPSVLPLMNGFGAHSKLIRAYNN
jgi:hypothetical protein